MVCDWELAEVRKKDALDRARVRGERLPPELLAEERGMHSSIEADVKRLLQGKSYVELEALQSQIEAQMQSGTAKVVEYWESVLIRLHIFKAKVNSVVMLLYCFRVCDALCLINSYFQFQACLKEIHAKLLRKHLQRLEKPLEVGDSERELTPQPDEEDAGSDGKGVEILSCLGLLLLLHLNFWLTSSSVQMLKHSLLNL